MWWQKAIQIASTELKVVYALRLGKAARIISTQNIFFSILILSVLIPGALIGV